MISPNRSLADVCPEKALLWAEFRTQYDLAGVRVTDNLGRAVGAPKTLQLGDGTTASTFPTQLVGRRGFSFDGGDYVDTGIIDPFERTDRFTLFVVTSAMTSINGQILVTYDSVLNSGIRIINNGANTISIYIQDGGYYIHKYNAGVVTPAVSTIALTSNGSSTAAGISTYYNNIPGLFLTANDILTSGTIKNGKSFLIGARHNGAGKIAFLTGNVHAVFVFPWELAAQQVQYLHRYCVTRINQP